MSARTEEHIDAVYLWVDPDDPSLRVEIERWRGTHLSSDAVATRRFRDNGELRYSLRSLEHHAPWIDRIHVVTNGRPPAWLDTAHPRLTVVGHNEVFPDPTVLPVFNSCAIELNLHRIPGVTRRFLYLNDDLFLGRDITRDDYLPADGRQRFYFEPNPLPSSVTSGPVHDCAYAYTAALLDRLPRKRRTSALSAGAYSTRRLHRILPPPVRELARPRRLLPAHVPQLYDCDVLREVEQLLPVEFAATRAHRFRAADDLVLRILYAFFLLECAPGMLRLEAALLDWQSSDYHFVRMQGSREDAETAIARTLVLNPRFLCVNDDLADDAALDHPQSVLWRRALKSRYPSPSCFERTEGSSPRTHVRGV